MLLNRYERVVKLLKTICFVVAKPTSSWRKSAFSVWHELNSTQLKEDKGSKDHGWDRDHKKAIFQRFNGWLLKRWNQWRDADALTKKAIAGFIQNHFLCLQYCTCIFCTVHWNPNVETYSHMSPRWYKNILILHTLSSKKHVFKESGVVFGQPMW